MNTAPDCTLIRDASAPEGFIAIYDDGSHGAYVPLRFRAALGLA